MEDTPQANHLEAQDEVRACLSFRGGRSRRNAHQRTFQISAPNPEPGSTGANANESTSPKDTGDPVLVPTKVHLRGVDTLTTEDIKSYASDHFGAVDRVEWIDDTSVNLLFGSEAIAQDALVSLCAIPIADPTQLPTLESLPAKPFSGWSK